MKNLFLSLLVIFPCLLSASPLEILERTTLVNERALNQEKEYYVLVSLSPYCPCSDSHLLHLDELSKKHPHFSFIGFDTDKLSSKKEIREFYNSKNLNFTVVKDNDLELARALQAVTTPHAFVINRKSGELLYQGAVTNSSEFSVNNQMFLKQALLEISRGEKVTRARTRPHGCTINY